MTQFLAKIYFFLISVLKSKKKEVGTDFALLPWPRNMTG